jgi:hypothetical protein
MQRKVFRRSMVSGVGLALSLCVITEIKAQPAQQVDSLPAQSSDPVAENTAPIFPPAPGHEHAPVVVLAHYMPQIPLGHGHAHPHMHGNSDAWPFLTQNDDRKAEYVQHIRSALSAGIHGFQMLTWPDSKMFEAAEQVYRETGELFYIVPDWSTMGGNIDSDPEKGAKHLADFAEKYRDSPHSLHVDGRQLHFFYGGVPWAATRETHQQTLEALKRRGVNPLLVPTHYGAEKMIMGMPPNERGLHYPVEPFVPYQPQGDRWLRETLWDGVTELSSRNLDNRYDALRAVRDQTAPHSGRFLYVPPVTMGYDSSTRLHQATHDKFYGIRRLRDGLKQAYELGFRVITLATWNDVTETPMLPSSRSPYGYAETCRYLTGIARTGQSPFTDTRFIAAFNPEVIIGDEWFFQMLVLPKHKQVSIDYKMTVRLEGLDGREVATLSGLARIRHEREDAIAEARWDTTGAPENTTVVSPVVTITAIDPASGARETVFSGLRLPPVRLRHNKIHFMTPYTISLNMVAPDATLDLQGGDAPAAELDAANGSLVPLHLKSSGGEAWRRLSLAESQLPLGAFRADDRAADSAGRHRVFLRVDLSVKNENGRWTGLGSGNYPGRLTVDNGTIHEGYSVWENLAQGFLPCGKDRMEISYKSPNIYGEIMPWVYRLTAGREDPIRLFFRDSEKPIVTTTIAQLLSKPVQVEFTADRDYLLDVRLTTDLTDPNIDFPVSAQAELQREIPLDSSTQAVRIFHAWGLTESGKVAYSKPVAVRRTPLPGQQAVITDPATVLPVRFIRTQGAFDDFRNATCSSSRNPFTAQDVYSGPMKAENIPYYLLDLEEGTGNRANYNGTGNQLGYGMLQGDCTWVPGWKGTGVRLGKGGRIALRSKSGPHGCTTISLRMLWDPDASKGLSTIYEDGDWWQNTNMGPLQVLLTGDGKMVARSFVSGGGPVTADATLSKGWNHLAIVYDLTELRLYLNGKPCGKITGLKPGYKRTHSLPFIGFSRIRDAKKEDGTGLEATVDQIEVIGTALTDADIAALAERGQWLAR